jgi:dTDP-4-amino-4,6-dideoxygalactose transaminase
MQLVTLATLEKPMAAHSFIPYGKPHLDEADRLAVAEVLTTDQLTRGPQVERFEAAVAEYCGAPHAVAFNSGTTALHAAYFAAGVCPFDRIVTTPLTYVGTVTGAVLLGAKLLLTDIDPRTGLPEVSQMLTEGNVPHSRGRPVFVPVHYRGTAVDMIHLTNGIREPTAVVIEDAAHALGATYLSGERVGCCYYSDMTVFSFHPVKSITSAEGGMVLTRSPEMADRLRQFRNNGIRKKPEEPHLYSVEFLSGIFHMSDLHAALGHSQMAKLDTFIARRRMLARYYRERLADVPYVQPLPVENEDHSCCHLFVVTIDWAGGNKDRPSLMRALHAAGIGSQVHYIPLHRHPALKGHVQQANAPQAEALCDRILTLPLYYDLREKEIDYIVTTLQKLIVA